MADPTLFATVFPEFGAVDTTGAVAYWLAQAALQLDARRLGGNFDLASMLFAAHNITLGKQEQAAASRGAIPGDALGPIASKSAGGLSGSYDASSITIEGAGAYNATSYGQRLYKLLQSAAMGGIYRAPPRRPHVFGYGRGGIF